MNVNPSRQPRVRPSSCESCCSYSANKPRLWATIVAMLRLWVVLFFAYVAPGCVGTRTAYREPPPEAPPPATALAPLPPAAQRPGNMYALDEALADALSGPLHYIGTGPWQGIQRLHACAYHNDRVLVVDVYCAVTPPKAARIDIYSPTRGHARLYAEAKAPVSGLDRRDYFSFVGETQPAPLRRVGLPPIRLPMSLPELQAYEQQRYKSFLPACYGGVEVHRAQGGCLGDLASHAVDWSRENRAFLKQPPQGWYRLLAELRALATQHGRDP